MSFSKWWLLEPVNYVYRIVSLSRISLLKEDLKEATIVFLNCDIKLEFTCTKFWGNWRGAISFYQIGHGTLCIVYFMVIVGLLYDCIYLYCISLKFKYIFASLFIWIYDTNLGSLLWIGMRCINAYVYDARLQLKSLGCNHRGRKLK